MKEVEETGAIDEGDAPEEGEDNPGRDEVPEPAEPIEEPPSEGPPVGTTHFRFFSSSSFWNEEPAATAPLDAASAEIVGAFNAEVEAEQSEERGPSINTNRWSVPLYTVPANQPTIHVSPTRGGSRALWEAWSAVPLPADARASYGTDKHLVVWQPSSDKLWEFWHLEQTHAGWQAGWGGAIEHVSTDPGAYGPWSWRGSTFGWGGSATSLSLAGGLITLEDLEAEQINHALALGIPNVRSGVYSSPALRGDGLSPNPLALPEGAHLRLDPNLDLGSLHLPRFTLMLAEAAQRYGIFVRSRAGVVAFYGQDPTPTGSNPYLGSSGYFGGKSRLELFEAFPWEHLQLLRMDLHPDP